MLVHRALVTPQSPAVPPRVFKDTEPCSLPGEQLSPEKASPCIPLQQRKAQMDDKKNPNSHSPTPWPSWLEGKALGRQWEGAVGGSDLPLSQTEEGAFVNMDEHWKYVMDQHYDMDQHYGMDQACIEQELSPRQVPKYQELSDWEEYIKQEQTQEDKSYKEPSSSEEYIKGQNSQGDDSSYQTLPDWEDSSLEDWFQGNESISPEVSDEADFSQEEESQGTASIHQELLSDWEDSIIQELSQDYRSLRQEFSDWEDSIVSVLCQWEDDSDGEFTPEDREYTSVHEIEVKPLRPEGDEWEERSIPELCQGEGREERLGICVAEGFSVPAPPKARAERRAPALHTQVPLCIFPAQLAAQAPRGAAASPALQEQVAEAGTRSQGPAPRSPCCSPSPSHAHMALPKKRPSRVRRALGALGRLLLFCLVGQPED